MCSMSCCDVISYNLALLEGNPMVVNSRCDEIVIRCSNFQFQFKAFSIEIILER